MNKEQEIEHANLLWEEARDTALHAHNSWSALINSRDQLIKGIQSKGVVYSKAKEAFTDLMSEHSERYKIALERMQEVEEEYKKIIGKYEEEST